MKVEFNKETESLKNLIEIKLKMKNSGCQTKTLEVKPHQQIRRHEIKKFMS